MHFMHSPVLDFGLDHYIGFSTLQLEIRILRAEKCSQCSQCSCMELKLKGWGMFTVFTNSES